MDFTQSLKVIRQHLGSESTKPTRDELDAALEAFERGLPLHHCYNNDRFAVAVLCDEPLERQRMVAGLAARNGRTKYWEWKTHFKFDAMAALKKLGIVAPDAVAPDEKPEYWRLDSTLTTALMDFAEGRRNQPSHP